MQLGNGRVNSSLQLICCATLAPPHPFLERQSRFVAELVAVHRADGFGDTCKRRLLERAGAAREELPGKCGSLLGERVCFHPWRSGANSTDHRCGLPASSITAAFRYNTICQPGADFRSPAASALL